MLALDRPSFTDPCNLSPDPVNSTSWLCPICTVLSSPTLVQLLLVDPVLCPVAMLAGFVLSCYIYIIVLINIVLSAQEYALFEPGCRHVAKDLMGTNRANPAAMILSATMMLRHLGSVQFSLLPQFWYWLSTLNKTRLHCQQHCQFNVWCDQWRQSQDRWYGWWVSLNLRMAWN
jgi:hypothetical protein